MGKRGWVINPKRTAVPRPLGRLLERQPCRRAAMRRALQSRAELADYVRNTLH